MAIIVIGLVAVFLIGYGVSRIWNQPIAAGVSEGTALQPAPDLALSDYQGNIVSLTQFRGRPVMVNSWAAWCPFCREELKDFATVQRELGDRVVIIAIDRAESLEIAKRYTDELGVTDELMFLLDPTDSFYRSIGGFSMPETIFVDREGRVRFHKRGPMKLPEIRERTRELLAS